MKNKFLLLVSILAINTSFILSGNAETKEQSKPQSSPKDMNIMVLRVALDNLMPGIIPDSIEETPMKGIYEVSYGTSIFYFNKDGSYMLKGDLIDLKTKVNLSEARRSGARLAMIESMGEESMIVYPAKNEKHKVTVFTDIDCPYCVKLHREMPAYHEQGITVRYMAYPRAGIGSPSYDKIVSVWCSKDKQKAMSDSKNGLQIEKLTCDNPVKKHFEMGQVLGVRGTPAIFLEDGTLLPGYVPASRLKGILQESK